jgi:glyoxylase-like metal-dependent hydrolase (beta-lactamase superfamily II)
VALATGTVVLASDAAGYHEEMDHDRPFYVYTDLLAIFRAYELLRDKASRQNTWVVTGHDEARWTASRPSTGTASTSAGLSRRS